MLSAVTSALTETGASIPVQLKSDNFQVTQLNLELHILRCTFQEKECYTLPPVSTSSGHHSDGVVCVALEVSEDGVSCYWVTELQGGLTTSLRMVGHSCGVEAVGSCP